MPGMSMAGMAQRLDEEQRSNEKLQETLRLERAQALSKQLQLEHELFKLNYKVEKMTERLQSKDKVISEQNEELFQVRTQIAALTDLLKRARASGKRKTASGLKNNENKWRYIEKEQADKPLSGASGQKNNDDEAKERSDGPSGGPSGKRKRL